MSLDMTSFDAALKVHYTNERIARMAYENNPLLAMLAKTEDFGGKNLPIPIIFATEGGRSASFANAQTNVDEFDIDDFVLTRVSDYAVAHIDNETIEASKGKNDAFMEAVTTSIDEALHSLTRSLAISLYRNGSGSLGRVSNSGPTTTITLTNIEDIVNFYRGQTLVLSTADGGGSLKTGTTKVTKVNRDTGVITVATDVSTFTAAGAQNDYIFVQGDYDAKLKGLDAWVPSSAPGATLFFGVDRSVDTTRLGGVRYDGSAQPIEEALIDACKRVGREGGSPDKCFMNFDHWADLEKSLQGRVQYVDLSVDGMLGFRGIQINGPKGPIDVVPDVNCPPGAAYLLQMDVWKFYGLGKTPRIWDDDGNLYLRRTNADGIEIRALYRGQLGCRAPGWNCRVALAT